MAQEDSLDGDELWPTSEDNYPSALTPENQAYIRAQYLEDVEEGMAQGPYLGEAAVAAALERTPDDLCFGALAVRDEADGRNGPYTTPQSTM